MRLVDDKRFRGLLMALVFVASTLAAASAFLGEALDAAGGVNELRLPVKKGWQFGAISIPNLSPLIVERVVKIVAAGAVHRNGMIVGVNTGFARLQSSRPVRTAAR
jgi:hypothetical protein